MNTHVPPHLCLSDLVHSGAVVGEVRTGSKRFWTVREEKVLRESFASGGPAACMPLLPGRSAGSIYQHAGKLGLRSVKPQGGVREPRWSSTEHMDAVIRREYANDTSKGAVAALARRLGRPRWWVSKRAVKLGIVPPRRKEPTWTVAEIAILAANATKSPHAIRAVLKRQGFTRTATAIIVKIKRAAIDRSDPDRMTPTDLAALMGVDRSTVGHWIAKGWLKAKQSVPGGTHLLRRPDVARFVVENTAAVDIRKVDKFWFVDLLAERHTMRGERA